MPKLACPSCNARYNVPVEKLGKRVKCPKCGQAFVLESPPDDDAVFPDLDSLEMGKTVPMAPLPPPPAAVAAPHRRAAPAAPITAASLSAYFADVVGFVRFFTQPWELMTLVVVGGACVLQLFVRFLPCVGLFGSIAITGWYFAFLLKTVQSGAARDEGLPDFSLSEGTWEGIGLPCLSFLSVRLLVIVPVVAVLIFAVKYARLDGEIALLIGATAIAMPELAMLLAIQQSADYPQLATLVVPALLAGLAAAPMLILVVAIGGINALLRVDLMGQTILRTLPGYAAATAVYFTSLGIAVGIGYLAEEVSSAALASAASRPTSGFESLQAYTGATVISVLASIFAMRAIGLYYAHFKKNFAWSWG